MRGRRGRHGPARRALAAHAVLVCSLLACGETRRPIGEECIRSDDCLSGVCSARTCVSAPDRVSGGGDDGADAGPRLAEGRDGGDGG